MLSRSDLLTLLTINFIVVTKGAERISEVSARFTLDAMPGKQMAIDADLNAGLINQTQAQTRRKDVASAPLCASAPGGFADDVLSVQPSHHQGFAR